MAEETKEKLLEVEGVRQKIEELKRKVGEMADYIPSDADLQIGFDGIPRFPGNEF